MAGDFSMWKQIAEASIVVQLVILMLVGASFWSWSVIIQKLISYRTARREATPALIAQAASGEGTPYLTMPARLAATRDCAGVPVSADAIRR